MKKFLLSLLAIGMMGSSVAQMAIPGGIFADDPTRFNGRKVTVKNIQIDFADLDTQYGITTPPGPIGTPTKPLIAPCRPPRGFVKVKVFFLEKPEYDACFFMVSSMYEQLKRETGGVTTDARITFRGEPRIGYHITFYRLGQ
tara:strand:- start:1056 stop:1481 length:426 start_codon:yes stop_codon:yes gene_type:complete